MKKIISIILSMAMLLSVCTAFAVANTDDAPPVAINEALALQKLGILKGTHNGLDLSKPVTRAEAVTFISRISGAVFTDIAPASPSFDDIKGHWASDIIEKFNRAGYVGGTSDRTFTPERTVSGKEFVKILLSVMGYSDVTIDNAYGTAVDAGVLANDFSKSAVSNNRELLRSDIVRILFDSFCAKLPSGQTLHASLVEKGLFKSGDFDEVLRCDYSDGDVLFADKFNTYMPTNKNYMFSPLSIKMALALAANGAAGATKDEILRAINIKDLDFFNSYSKEMIAKYISGDVLRLDIANSIWLNTSMTDKVFSEAYKKTVADFYSGSANVVTHDNAIGKINSWVNEKTNKKIPTIIDNSEFEAMLINAIYFNGEWESKFAESLTKKADFTDRNGKKTSIDFMNKTSWMPYASMDGVQIVELPYADKRREYEGTGELIEKAESNDINVSMYVILSDKDDINPQEILTN
ncbi:MAG: serpin family protein, partial [Clostridia bacterium]